MIRRLTGKCLKGNACDLRHYAVICLEGPRKNKKFGHGCLASRAGFKVGTFRIQEEVLPLESAWCNRGMFWKQAHCSGIRYARLGKTTTATNTGVGTEYTYHDEQLQKDEIYEKKEPTDDTDTDVYSQLVLSQRVSDIIMPIVRRTDCIKPRVVLAWMCWLRLCGAGTRAERWMLVYQHSHSALSSSPDSTQPQPAHPG